MVLAPLVRSPLRLRWRDERFVAEDVDGQLILDGVAGSASGSELITLETVAGRWRVLRAAADRSHDVLDADGKSVARLERRGIGRTEIVLPNERRIPVSASAFSLANCARIGDLVTVRAPYLFPRRYLTLRFDDRFLAHRSRELVLALGAHTAWARIQTKFTVGATG
jgi:hypothetical protein